MSFSKCIFHKSFLLILALVLLVPFTYATTLHGTIYDLELTPVENALVEIDTQPPQRYLAKDGSYSFEVPKGTFTIKVTYSTQDLNDTYHEDVVVKEEGRYIFDIFLFPETSEEEELLESAEMDLDVEEQGNETNLILWAGIIILILLIFLILIRQYFRFKRKDESEQIEKEIESDYEKLILEMLHKN
ncbi:MAG: hypothetical protein KJ574_01770, partial [Nanoarchaeota archaeon]|nr:hypothetical protein [Nanoarchaeota archaeon]